MEVLTDIIRRKLLNKYYGAERLPETPSSSEAAEVVCVFADEKARLIKCKDVYNCPVEPETSSKALNRIDELCKGIPGKTCSYSEQFRDVSSKCVEYYDLVGSKRLFQCLNNCNRPVLFNSCSSSPDLHYTIPKKASANKRVTFARPDCHLPAKKRALVNSDGSPFAVPSKTFSPPLKTPTPSSKTSAPPSVDPKVPIFNDTSKEQLFEVMKHFTNNLFNKEKNRKNDIPSKNYLKVDGKSVNDSSKISEKKDLSSKRKKTNHHHPVSPKLVKTIVKKSAAVQWKQSLDKKLKKQLIQKHMEKAQSDIHRKCQELLRSMRIRDQSAQGIVHPMFEKSYVNEVRRHMSKTWSRYVPMQEVRSDMDKEWLCCLTAKITKSMRQRNVVEDLFLELVEEYDTDNVEPRFSFTKRKPFRSFTVKYAEDEKCRKTVAEVAPKDSNTPDYDGIFEPSIYRDKANRFDSLVKTFQQSSIDDKYVYRYEVRHLFIYCVDSAFGDINNTLRDLYCYQVRELPPSLPTPNALVDDLIKFFRKRGKPQDNVVPRYYRDQYEIFFSCDYLRRMKRLEENELSINCDSEDIEAVNNLQIAPYGVDETGWPVRAPMLQGQAYDVLYQQRCSESPMMTYSPVCPSPSSTPVLSSCKYANNNNARFTNNNGYTASPPQPLPPLQTLLKHKSGSSVPPAPNSDSSGSSPPDVYMEILATPMCPDFSHPNHRHPAYNGIWNTPSSSAATYGRNPYVSQPSTTQVQQSQRNDIYGQSYQLAAGPRPLLPRF